jgi:hypothetical protein
MYAAYIWPLFMEQQGGAQAVAAAWRALEHAQTWDQALGAIDAQVPFAANSTTSCCPAIHCRSQSAMWLSIPHFPINTRRRLTQSSRQSRSARLAQRICRSGE